MVNQCIRSLILSTNYGRSSEGTQGQMLVQDYEGDMNKGLMWKKRVEGVRLNSMLW